MVISPAFPCLLSFMVLAPLHSGGVAIPSRVCPPTKGALPGEGSRSRQGSALMPWTLRVQKQVGFSQTAVSYLRSLGWPFISIIFVTKRKQVRVSPEAPTCKVLLCFCPLLPAYLPLLPPWGCRLHSPAVPAGRHTPPLLLRLSSWLRLSVPLASIKLFPCTL